MKGFCGHISEAARGAALGIAGLAVLFFGASVAQEAGDPVPDEAAAEDASPAPVIELVAKKPIADWIVAQWEEDAEALIAAYDEMFFAAPPMPVQIEAETLAGRPGRLLIAAAARPPATLVIALGGQGWGEPSVSGQAALRRNLAHELAHLYQLTLRDDPNEARWLHEGSAEVLAHEALLRAGLWDEATARANDAELERSCVRALSRGALIDRFAEGDRDAIYGCGYIVSDTAVRISQENAHQLYSQYALEGSGIGLGFYGARAVGREFLSTAARFVRQDHTGQDPNAVITGFRAGRY